MTAPLEEIAKGTGFLRGVGYGVTRMFGITSERVKEIRKLYEERPLFYIGSFVGRSCIGLIGAYGIYELYKAIR